MGMHLSNLCCLGHRFSQLFFIKDNLSNNFEKPLKARFELQPVPKYEPSTYQTIG